MKVNTTRAWGVVIVAVVVVGVYAVLAPSSVTPRMLSFVGEAKVGASRAINKDGMERISYLATEDGVLHVLCVTEEICKDANSGFRGNALEAAYVGLGTRTAAVEARDAGFHRVNFEVRDNSGFDIKFRTLQSYRIEELLDDQSKSIP